MTIRVLARIGVSSIALAILAACSAPDGTSQQLSTEQAESDAPGNPGDPRNAGSGGSLKVKRGTSDGRLPTGVFSQETTVAGSATATSSPDVPSSASDA